MKYYFFNVFTPSHFEINNFKFRCVFDLEYTKKIPKDIDILTHIAQANGNEGIQKSIFFDDKKDTQLKDISFLLTIFQGTHVFCKNHQLGRVSNTRKEDLKFFLADEISSLLDKSFINLSKMDSKRFEIIKMALFMFYEAKHMLIYDGLRNILMMNCFEFLIGSIYRQDENYSKTDLKLNQTYKHIIEKFKYQIYVDGKLKKMLSTNEKIKEFKKERDIESIASFVKQFEKMRNWIAHGKQHNKPALENSPSDSEFTFFYKLENFIKVILADLIYKEDYTRKFDILHQLILEQNCCVILTPETAELKFMKRSKSVWVKGV